MSRETRLVFSGFFLHGFLFAVVETKGFNLKKDPPLIMAVEGEKVIEGVIQEAHAHHPGRRMCCENV